MVVFLKRNLRPVSPVVQLIDHTTSPLVLEREAFIPHIFFITSDNMFARESINRQLKGFKSKLKIAER